MMGRLEQKCKTSEIHYTRRGKRRSERGGRKERRSKEVDVGRVRSRSEMVRDLNEEMGGKRERMQ